MSPKRKIAPVTSVSPEKQQEKKDPEVELFFKCYVLRTGTWYQEDQNDWRGKYGDGTTYILPVSLEHIAETWSLPGLSSDTPHSTSLHQGYISALQSLLLVLHQGYGLGLEGKSVCNGQS